MKPLREWSRSTLMLVAIGGLLLIGYLGGCFGTDAIKVQQGEAISIALEQIDFVPEGTETRLGRHGFENRPVWAVLFWVADPTADDGFERRTVVEVDGTTGEVQSIVSDE